MTDAREVARTRDIVDMHVRDVCRKGMPASLIEGRLAEAIARYGAERYAAGVATGLEEAAAIIAALPEPEGSVLRRIGFLDAKLEGAAAIRATS